MKKFFVGACVIACLTLSSISASASSIVFSQPSVWSGNGTSVGASWTSETADGAGYVTFDNFSFATATVINQVTWYGLFLNLDFTDGTPNTSRWDLLINSDGGGSPNALIGGTLNASVTRTAVGDTLFNGNRVTVYQFVGDFADFTASAGTTYWFAPVSVGEQGNFAPFFSWIEGTGGDGQSFQVQLDNFVVTDTFVRNEDRAFSLVGSVAAEVPEPASLALLGFGVTGIVASRRLRTRK